MGWTITTVIVRPIILSATFPVTHDFLWHTSFNLHPFVVNLVQLVIGQGSLNPFGLFEGHKAKATVPLRLSIHHHHSILNLSKLSKVLFKLLQITSGRQTTHENLDHIVHATAVIMLSTTAPTTTMSCFTHGPFAIHSSTVNFMGSTHCRFHGSARCEGNKAKAT